MILCGNKDGNKVSYSTLSTSCSNAMRNCSSASCVSDYVWNAFNDRLYKFCSNSMNVLVTAHGWGSWAYGLEYYDGAEYYCIAYCTK